jgi:hypothetical protein
LGRVWKNSRFSLEDRCVWITLIPNFIVSSQGTQAVEAGDKAKTDGSAVPKTAQRLSTPFQVLLVLLALLPVWYHLIQLATAKAEEPRNMWWCPKCTLELPCQANETVARRPCPRCSQRGGVMQILTLSGEQISFTDVLVRGMIALVAFLSVVMLLVYGGKGRAKKGAKTDKAAKAPPAVTDEGSVWFPCPNCSYPIRFHPAKVGAKDICPDCDQEFTYPRPATGESAQEEHDINKWARELAASRHKRKGKS